MNLLDCPSSTDVRNATERPGESPVSSNAMLCCQDTHFEVYRNTRDRDSRQQPQQGRSAVAPSEDSANIRVLRGIPADFQPLVSGARALWREKRIEYCLKFIRHGSQPVGRGTRKRSLVPTQSDGRSGRSPPDPHPVCKRPWVKLSGLDCIGRSPARPSPCNEILQPNEKYTTPILARQKA